MLVCTSALVAACPPVELKLVISSKFSVGAAAACAGHGSQFDNRGRLICGPAKTDLVPINATSEADLRKNPGGEARVL